MPDGTAPPPTTDEQIDTEVTIAEVYDTIGSLPGIFGFPVPTPAYHAGGGGDGGQYQLSPAELDVLIGRWTVLHAQVRYSGDRIRDSLTSVQAPAEDAVSVRFTRELIASLKTAHDHNARMADYAKSYIDKLTAARAGYNGTEVQNSAAMNGSGT